MSASPSADLYTPCSLYLVFKGLKYLFSLLNWTLWPLGLSWSLLWFACYGILWKFVFFNLPLPPKSLVPRMRKAKCTLEGWMGGSCWLLLTVLGQELWGRSISQITASLPAPSQLVGLTWWLLCARRPAGPLKNYLAASCAYWRPKWLKRWWKAENETKEGDLIDFFL